MSSIKNNLNDNDLIKFRKEIDEIDNSIIDLLLKRMDIVDKVADFKKSRNDHLFIRSNREADMIKKIVNKIGDRYPKSHIIAMWRKIIASANLHEQFLNIGIYNPDNVSDYKYLIYEYYSRDFPIKYFSNARELISQIENNEIKIGVLPVPKLKAKDFWWRLITGESIKVFAKIPFIKNQLNDDFELFCIGKKLAEPSQEDITLIDINSFDIELNVDDINKIFADINLNLSKVIDIDLTQKNKHYLCEISGYHKNDCRELEFLRKSKLAINILGYYATQIN